MELIVVALAGAAVPIGVLVAVSARRAAPRPVVWRPQHRSTTITKATIGLVAGVLVLAATGWIVPAVLAGAAGWWAAGLVIDREARSPGELERVEAVATWTEQVRDVLLAGDQPVGAIQATVTTAPEPIRPQVRALAARLGRQPEDVVLRRWADELDDPAADLVAAGLWVALTQGGRAEAVLSSLAAQARRQAERRKLLEAERALARREVWWVTGLMTAQVVGGLLLVRSHYLAPYRTAQGQVVLCLLLATFVALIVYVQRLARFPRPARFLTMRGAR
jgi:tight adherence protein B